MKPMLIVPEFILLQTIENALAFVREDYEINKTAGTPDKSYLYLLLNGTSFQRYNFYEQAKAIICRDIDDPRYLEVDLMFNMKRDGAPSIHITLPAEMTDAQGNGMGDDEGYREPIWYDGDPDAGVAGQWQSVYTRRFTGTYNVVITSDNTNEVIFLHHFIRALLIATKGHLSLLGLQNIVLGGQDIAPYSDMMPPNLFMRAISVNLQYETSAPHIFKEFMVNAITFEGKAVNDTHSTNTD